MRDNQAVMLQFLIEFRKRLIICLTTLALIFVLLFYFANELYTLLALPLLKHLPHGQSLIATNIVAPFFVPFELTFVVSLFFAVPIFLYQIWAFIAPALYQHERRFVWLLLVISVGLFYLGVAFAYFVIFPIIFNFFAHTTPQGVLLSPDISQYLDFTLKLFLIFGMIFEVPVITILLIWTKVVTREKLINLRPYIIVSAFIIGMLLGPPDVLSQTLLAVPLWLLFELGVFAAKFFPERIQGTELENNK
ncbi:MAG: twin-arginine translocase subunit TatC [Gammaproteobacteria bacterium]